MRILLDCDGVLSDFVNEALNFVNDPKRAGYDRPRKREEISDFNLFKAWGCPELWPAFNDYISQPGRVLGMQIEPGSREFVSALRDLGTVEICTSPYKGASHWIYERLIWLESHFGFKPDDVCVWSRKYRLEADVLIDDAKHNAIEFMTGRVDRNALLLDQPWNQGPLPHGVIRCADLQDTLAVARDLNLKGLI